MCVCVGGEREFIRVVYMIHVYTLIEDVEIGNTKFKRTREQGSGWEHPPWEHTHPPTHRLSPLKQGVVLRSIVGQHLLMDG